MRNINMFMCFCVLCIFALLWTACDEGETMIAPNIPNQWPVASYPYAAGTLNIISGFTGPYGITITEPGNIYVSDLKEGRVVRISRYMTCTGWLGMVEGDSNSASGWHTTGTPARGTEIGMLNMPHSVDFAADGTIFVADYANGRIHKYSPNGQFLGLFFDPPSRPELTFDGCANASFDRDFNLWVSDFDAHRVFKFDPAGNLIGWLGEFESGQLTNGFADTGSSQLCYQLGGLHKPQMVHTDAGGNIYIVETGNHRIQKFSPAGISHGWIGARNDGTLTAGWTLDGQSGASALPGGFNAPVSLQIVGDSIMIITDNTNHRIQKFSLDGHFLGWLGGRADSTITAGWETTGLSGPGDAPGMFLHPFDARLIGNKLYVADGHNGRVQIFTLGN